MDSKKTKIPQQTQSTQKPEPRVVAAIPCFNTEHFISDIVSRARKYVDQVIVIDDSSHDGTAEAARVAGAGTTSVQRDESFEIDVAAARDAIDARSKIIFVSSPNNPTGNIVSEEQVKDLLETGLLVVVDEAYYEFCGKTVAALTSEFENLVVLRTMSKWAGLAGLRVGYGIMSPKLIDHIIDIKQPYNISTVAEAALLASLEDAEALLRNVDLIVRERERMFSLLEGIPGVKPWPSGGNFVLCQFGLGRAGGIFEELAQRGIFLRKFSSSRLADFFRISVGTPEQTDAVILALAELV